MDKKLRNVAIGVGALAVAVAAVIAGVALWSREPVARSSLLAEYLAARAEGDAAGAAALVSDDFVEELGAFILEPGSYRAWSFSAQVEDESLPVRFVVAASDRPDAPALLLDAYFARSGIQLKLTALRKVAEGEPIVR
ncbi:MAG TPA: hypothetical protein PKW82_08520 [Spirochaetales bacterium]|nr:hypothetical protein [Spirochaetales bacterium]